MRIPVSMNDLLHDANNHPDETIRLIRQRPDLALGYLRDVDAFVVLARVNPLVARELFTQRSHAIVTLFTLDTNRRLRMLAEHAPLLANDINQFRIGMWSRQAGTTAGIMASLGSNDTVIHAAPVETAPSAPVNEPANESAAPAMDEIDQIVSEFEQIRCSAR